MRTYELVTIFSPMLSQEQAAEAWGRVKDFITSRDAEITREQSWGTRRLAYPIRKGSINFLEGSYYLTQFATERPFNFDLETFLRRDERVLRSLVTVADPDAPIAQPGMAAAAARAAAVEAAAAAEVAAAAAAEADAIAAAEAEPATEESVAEAEPIAEAEPATEESVAEAEPIAEAEPAVEEPVAEVDPVEVDPVEVEPVSEPESQSEEERSES
ncbi:MAG: 30S ribosomal protein S6 [Chloroflexi bacterium]|nr:30S ribosomal protein S6 [Chloroflexota bacterium]